MKSEDSFGETVIQYIVLTCLSSNRYSCVDMYDITCVEDLGLGTVNGMYISGLP